MERGGEERGKGCGSVDLTGLCQNLGMLILNTWEPVGSFERGEMN